MNHRDPRFHARRTMLLCALLVATAPVMAWAQPQEPAVDPAAPPTHPAEVEAPAAQPPAPPAPRPTPARPPIRLIELRSGRLLWGEVIGMDQQSITLRTSTSVAVVRRADVGRVFALEGSDPRAIAHALTRRAVDPEWLAATRPTAGASAYSGGSGVTGAQVAVAGAHVVGYAAVGLCDVFLAALRAH